MIKDQVKRAGLLAAVALGLFAHSAAGSTYDNSTSIALNDGAESPYPSTIKVAGLPGPVTYVRATLRGISYPFPRDIDVLLQGPGGQHSILMSDTCGDNTTPFTGQTLVIEDGAAVDMGIGGTFCPSGVYQPTENDPASDLFPAPAPGAPYSAALSIFNGFQANGTWNLFVRDDFSPDTGAIAGGWSLELLPRTNCGGIAPGKASLVGTAGNDKLVGTPGLDAILGLGGKDTIKGLGGDDQICGGSGRDILKGGPGVDNLKGEGGKDKLQGQGGRDKCIGGKGRDTASSCETEKSL